MRSYLDTELAVAFVVATQSITGIVFTVIMWMLNRPHKDAESNAAATKTYTNSIETMTVQVVKLTDLLDKKDTRLDEIESDNRTLRSSVASLTTKIEFLEREAKRKDSIIGKQEVRIKELEALQVKTKTSELEKEQMLGRMFTQIEQLKKEVDELRESLEEAEAEKKVLEERLKVYEEKTSAGEKREDGKAESPEIKATTSDESGETPPNQ